MHSSAQPETKYAESGGVSIAYQRVGEGPTEIVMVPGFASHLEHGWEHPKLAHFYNRLASFSQLTLLDKRGVGLSDRVSPGDLPGIEQRKDDLKTVMDAAGVERAVLVAASDGGPLAMLFAATNPERVASLVLINTYAKRLQSPDHEPALPSEVYQGLRDAAAHSWGEPLMIDYIAPDHVDDPVFRDWWAAALRRSMSPGAARAMIAMNAAIDVRAALPAIRVPTLVIHRTGDLVCPVEGGRFIAAHIEGAKLVELPGDDHFQWLGDSESVLSEIERFATGDQLSPINNVSLASMLFTDIVSSTEKAAELGEREWAALHQTHDGIVHAAVSRFGGREVKNTGDGSLIVFEGPARAARCWLAIRNQLQEIGLDIRGGLHVSEVEVTPNDLRGLGVHIAARLMSLAAPGQLVVSSVVRDLSVGSGLTFTEAGEHELKGVPGDWQVFGVTE